MEPTRYEYGSLEGDSTIRLLEMSPATTDSKLFGKLIHAQFDNEVTRYNCLSYAWGDPNFTEKIWLGANQFIPITNSLHLTLTNIGSTTDWSFTAVEDPKDAKIPIWVDAICINQEDIDEQSQQVRMMYSIYARAQFVFMHLGHGQDGDERIREICATIGRGFQAYDQDTAGRLNPEPIECGTYGLPPEDAPEWKILRRVAQLPYFTRVWVIQEVVAAKRHVAFLGSTAFDIGLLVFASLNVWRHQLPVFFREANKRLYSENTSTLGSLGVLDTETAHPTMGTRGVLQLRIIFALRGFMAGGRDVRLIEILYQCRDADATDPRDRIFALVGLSQDKYAPDLQADYRETVEEVYMRVAKYAIQTGDGPRVLCCAMGRVRRPGCPTWVPDWDSKSADGCLLHTWSIEDEKVLQPTAGGDEPRFRLMESHPQQLASEAIILDSILYLGQEANVPAARPCPDPARLIKNLNIPYPALSSIRLTAMTPTRLLDELMAAFSASAQYPEDSKSELIWRTAVCNQHKGPSTPAPSWWGSVLPALLIERRMLDMGLPARIFPPRDLNMFGEKIREVSLVLRSSYTRKGYVGMVPMDSQPGDIVAVLLGCPAPVVLRPKKNVYELVGEAYFHGFMDGEALTTEKFKQETIILV
ncbi:Heterokaryon incompatibility protein 6 like [Zalerion maritima]|uniref:Heterokaryon incompatibility protein 6 like n=1 Tax=Zalerion maritima TaxID=339359 RepID=A0AAD5WNY9_9PEZI|nr:Heterokaryon incompatibility protein 6 like [Zalerion maritima]